jgi:CheY-like chemotaxis protein
MDNSPCTGSAPISRPGSRQGGQDTQREVSGGHRLTNGRTSQPAWDEESGGQPARVVPAGAALPGPDGARPGGAPGPHGSAVPRSVASPPLDILVVEDEPANRRLVRAILGPAGYRLTFAGDGFEAVLLAERHGFALILMDYQLPRMDGVEATRAIRGSAGRSAGSPVVGLTACVQHAVRQSCLDAGMVDVIHKPVDPTVLEDAVARWARRLPSGGAGAA